ncbi:beta-ketoacyl-[acyl-carrier-protein] synthase family protein [Ligilactobacillus hohenheimensis]|uniref:beta-ketoacyl-[acyl-carrier-protein] synthase family protein n=1 Tax=Ligilactobacillus hohenheimensis TaxID=2991832 RepID=UPI0024B8CA76|nr:beta-ketoacyl-[acyl-carrier-protein] synthase family protein [Ligilactobacillus hohenheimensis]
MDDIVITGIGVVSPLGVGSQEFWENDFKGVSKIKHCKVMEDNNLKSKVYVPIQHFNIKDIINDDELCKKARFIQMGVAAGFQSIFDADFNEYYDPKDIAVIYSSAIGGTPEIQKIYEQMTSNGTTSIKNKEIGEEFYNDGMFNYPATYIAEKFDFKNVCCSLSTGCTAGLDAMITAIQLLNSNEAKAVVVGASEAPLCSLTYSTLDAIGALSKWNGKPCEASRPFDRKRAGFVISEGATALVLEKKEYAEKRNSKILAKISGAFSLNNAYHMTDLKDSTVLEHVIKRVMDMSKCSATDIDYINAHGSSTLQNDSCEANAIRNVFGGNAKNIPVSSTKSMMGHSLSSASLMAIVSTIGAIKYQYLPPNINYRYEDPKCNLNIVKRPRRGKVNNALVMASGFGGIHSACILQKV